MKSEVPTMDDFMRPILEYANQRRSFVLREITDAMADRFNLSPEARAELTRGGNIDKVYDRTSWSITHLKHAGFLRQLGRGRYEITDAGRKQLLLKDKISVSYLTQNVPAYQQWKQSRTSKKNYTTNEKASAIPETKGLMNPIVQWGKRQLEEITRPRKSISKENTEKEQETQFENNQSVDVSERLSRLWQLKQEGALTQEEFEKQKAKLLQS